MRARRSARPIHARIAVIHARRVDVDGMGTAFVGNPLSEPASSVQDRLRIASAAPAANAAFPRCKDFEPFLKEAEPVRSDFLFIDPPYDSDFSDYDNMPFGSRDQERLQQVLEVLSASVMVVIKDTPLIRRLYRSDRWRIESADKTYMWTIKSRNDRKTSHLTITNY